MKERIIAAIICLLTFFSCDSSLFEDGNMTFTKTEYQGHQLKINGYFFNKSKYDDTYSVFFLFHNGIAIRPLGDYTLSEFEDDLYSGKYIEQRKKIKHAWGLFQISNDTIKIEFLSSYGEMSAYPVTKIGKILNDSTIHFVKYMRSNGDYPEVNNDTFHLKVFSPKPDSTNQWIQ